MADELVDRAALGQGDLRHFGEIFVDQFGDLFGLQPFGGRGEILDVGKEVVSLLRLVWIATSFSPLKMLL